MCKQISCDEFNNPGTVDVPVVLQCQFRILDSKKYNKMRLYYNLIVVGTNNGVWSRSHQRVNLSPSRRPATSLIPPSMAVPRRLAS